MSHLFETWSSEDFLETIMPETEHKHCSNIKGTKIVILSGLLR